MAAATEDRDTARRSGNIIPIDVAAATTIYNGTLVANDASGNAVPASDAAGLQVQGTATEQADNATGVAGDIQVEVTREPVLMDNSVTNALDKSHVGTDCYVEDDQTVSSSGGTNSIVAGRVLEVTEDGVWIDPSRA
ncbi:MAG: hypothetical protein AAGD22_09410 [Verrucomicrobiota bacterium]